MKTYFICSALKLKLSSSLTSVPMKWTELIARKIENFFTGMLLIFCHMKSSRKLELYGFISPWKNILKKTLGLKGSSSVYLVCGLFCFWIQNEKMPSFQRENTTNGFDLPNLSKPTEKLACRICKFSERYPNIYRISNHQICCKYLSLNCVLYWIDI